MKIIKKILATMSIACLLFSCNKHVIEYESTNIGENVAEFQLHYMVPVTTGSANNIGRVLVNDSLYATTSSPLTPYNAIPSGAVGKFYTTRVGDNNFKCFFQKSKTENGKTVTVDSLVYNQNASLKKGKQNVFIYDFAKPPIVLDNEFPYPTNLTATTDSTAWIRFYNFLYESPTVYSTQTIQYQYQYIKDNVTGERSDWINIGKPLKFGEATNWEPVKINKTVQVSEGYANLYYRIRVIGADGSDLGDLEAMNSSNKIVPFTYTSTPYVGRHYHHILSGVRTTTPVSAIRVFTAL